MKTFDAQATCNSIFEFTGNAGWTDSKLAQALAVTPQAVSKWRKGTCAPSIDTIVMMTGLFHTSLDNLIKCRDVADYTLDDY
ncbi:MAG: helix-turn-helix domain-containing protein [Lachnospiraceae bacterium]|nr:helix-turn-helix domain-containing protein [Lachnospiraceae bacterium]